jgi:hypothetical protein
VLRPSWLAELLFGLVVVAEGAGAVMRGRKRAERLRPGEAPNTFHIKQTRQASDVHTSCLALSSPYFLPVYTVSSMNVLAHARQNTVSRGRVLGM